jgi:hypothetical protein
MIKEYSKVSWKYHLLNFRENKILFKKKILKYIIKLKITNLIWKGILNEINLFNMIQIILFSKPMRI